MRIIAHGIDLVECSRIADLLRRHPDHFQQRVLTEGERTAASRFKDMVPHVAGRFAAKEAILKALGTGWRGQIAWTDMEILNDPAGVPIVTLSGETARIAASRGITGILLSITHTRTHAAASAIAVG